MPAPRDRRGRLIPEYEFDELKEQERQRRIERFTVRAGGTPTSGRSRVPAPLETQEQEWEPPPPRSHDPNTLEASRARLIGAMNNSA